MQNPELAYDYLETLGKERGMKASEVKVGGVYTAKVSQKLVPVRIVRDHQSGGWVGKNEATGKDVRIRSARRLRYPVIPVGPADAQAKRLARGIDRALDAAEAAQAAQAAKEPQGAPQATPAPKGEKKAHRAPKGAKAPKIATGRKTGGKDEKPGSGLDAAAKVLAEAGEPLSCKQMVERAFEKGYWASEGKTPWATVYSAILREIQAKGDQARFRKAARGRFELVR
jgi:hypothetical protein